MQSADKIIEILYENLSEDIRSIDMDTQIANLQISSLLFIQIVVAIEEEFGIEFSDDRLEAETFSTVLSLAQYVDGLISSEVSQSSQ